MGVQGLPDRTGLGDVPSSWMGWGTADLLPYPSRVTEWAPQHIRPIGWNPKQVELLAELSGSADEQSNWLGSRLRHHHQQERVSPDLEADCCKSLPPPLTSYSSQIISPVIPVRQDPSGLPRKCAWESGCPPWALFCPLEKPRALRGPLSAELCHPEGRTLLPK